MTIGEFVRETTHRFEAAGIPTPRLDAQVLAAHVLKHDRSWLLAHDTDRLDAVALKKLERLTAGRLKRQPLAYLLGHKEFYGRQFTVTPDVLIPRPETEQIIDELKTLRPLPGDTLLDIGTGSGAVAITAALEWPGLTVVASDISPAALAVARRNTAAHHARVQFKQSDLLATVPLGLYRFIVANLPYVDTTWQRSPETNAEPPLALFANDGGLALIKTLLAQAPNRLLPGGFLLLEADPRQFEAIKKAAPQQLTYAGAQGFVLVFQRVKRAGRQV
jgi:release factor glutamine methyltransferase